MRCAVYVWCLANVTCSADEFQCEAGYCIPDELVCDGYVQCKDLSDERGCRQYIPYESCHLAVNQSFCQIKTRVNQLRLPHVAATENTGQIKRP